LKFDCEELLPSVCLNSLDRKWHLFGDLFEKSNGVGRRAPIKQPHDFISGAIIYCCILIEALRNLTDVHLHPVAWYGPVVTLLSLPISPFEIELRDPVSLENLIDGGNRQENAMKALQLRTDAPVT
jgi:hypothetical protein